MFRAIAFGYVFARAKPAPGAAEGSHPRPSNSLTRQPLVHMARVLMLVHRMGVHGPDWATELMIDLTTAASSYGLEGDFSDERTMTR